MSFEIKSRRQWAVVCTDCGTAYRGAWRRFERETARDMKDAVKYGCETCRGKAEVLALEQHAQTGQPDVDGVDNAKWFIGHRRPHVLGATSWYGAYHTREEAERHKPAVEKYWHQRAGIQGPFGYTFIERDDAADDCDYGQMTVDRHYTR